jgi:hypothetical protein
MLQAVGVTQPVMMQGVEALFMDCGQAPWTECIFDKPILDACDRRFAVRTFGKRTENIERNTHDPPRMWTPLGSATNGSRSRVAPPAVASRPLSDARARDERGQCDEKLCFSGDAINRTQCVHDWTECRSKRGSIDQSINQSSSPSSRLISSVCSPIAGGCRASG